MKRLFATLLFVITTFNAHAANQDNGLIRRASPYPVSETIDRLESVLRSKGIKIFLRIDHSDEAKKAGLTLRPMQLLIFGTPKSGTPLMQAAPSIGLDLPMKVLVWQDAQAHVWISWNDPEYVVQRHGLERADAKNINVIDSLIQAALNVDLKWEIPIKQGCNNNWLRYVMRDLPRKPHSKPRCPTLPT